MIHPLGLGRDREDTLARSRLVLSDGHPYTLLSASNLAADLRALGEADDL